MRQIILASTSPRRKELLEKMGLEFTVVPSDFDEYLDESRPVEEIAMELGRGRRSLSPSSTQRRLSSAVTP
ncbi:Maf family protein [Candidatus Saccharibacteria bacterium]|nr:MAG: Maf family protein [Candidatus Saccharibacteria bacterium]